MARESIAISWCYCGGAIQALSNLANIRYFRSKRVGEAILDIYGGAYQ